LLAKTKFGEIPFTLFVNISGYYQKPRGSQESGNLRRRR
jgi:translation initiation factor IF-3